MRSCENLCSQVTLKSHGTAEMHPLMAKPCCIRRRINAKPVYIYVLLFLIISVQSIRLLITLSTVRLFSLRLSARLTSWFNRRMVVPFCDKISCSTTIKKTLRILKFNLIYREFHTRNVVNALFSKILC